MNEEMSLEADSRLCTTLQDSAHLWGPQCPQQQGHPFLPCQAVSFPPKEHRSLRTSLRQVSGVGGEGAPPAEPSGHLLNVAQLGRISEERRTEVLTTTLVIFGCDSQMFHTFAGFTREIKVFQVLEAPACSGSRPPPQSQQQSLHHSSDPPASFFLRRTS